MNRSKDYFIDFIEKVKMTLYIKEPHATIFTDPTSFGKSCLVLDLIEKEYSKHFDYIIIRRTV